jgi:hypothetical protein
MSCATGARCGGSVVPSPPAAEPIADICRDVHTRSGALAERITACIEREIPAHADESATPFADLFAGLFPTRTRHAHVDRQNRRCDGGRGQPA